MKLEITLTDKQAAPFVAALEKLANPLVAAMPEPTPAPTLPEPPEGFHPAMMGPIKGCGNSGDYIPGIAIFDAYGSGEWCTKDDWSGNQPKRIYALRIGSNIARLNGLELTLELGRTYATNAGEIVTFTDACDGTMWNPIGQALIDGVAQPLSHPDSIREEIPAELLPLPKLPDGFKEWRWRGKGFSKSSIRFAFGDVKDGWEVSPCDWASGNALYNQRYYYLEAIPCTPDDVFGPEAIPADKEPETFRIQAGKRYVRRDGKTSFPVEANTSLAKFPFRVNGATYRADGTSWHKEGVECDWDLIQEYIEPEPVKRREWDASVSPGGSFVASHGEYQEFVRVREVLPGDPTPEQVESLADALRHALIRMEHLKSYQSGDSKSMPSVDACIEYTKAVLQPFTGKESE